MNEEDDTEAWHQVELETRHWQEMLAADPAYSEWLRHIETQRKVKHEISGETDDGF